jgi:hypothetical protein
VVGFAEVEPETEPEPKFNDKTGLEELLYAPENVPCKPYVLFAELLEAEFDGLNADIYLFSFFKKIKIKRIARTAITT